MKFKSYDYSYFTAQEVVEAFKERMFVYENGQAFIDLRTMAVYPKNLESAERWYEGEEVITNKGVLFKAKGNFEICPTNTEAVILKEKIYARQVHNLVSDEFIKKVIDNYRSKLERLEKISEKKKVHLYFNENENVLYGWKKPKTLNDLKKMCDHFDLKLYDLKKDSHHPMYATQIISSNKDFFLMSVSSGVIIKEEPNVEQQIAELKRKINKWG